MSNARRKNERRAGKADWSRLDSFWREADAYSAKFADQLQRAILRDQCARNKPNEPPADVTWEDRVRDVLWATGRNP